MTPRTPVSTYRLQLGPDLSFDDAAKRVPYLASLGITAIYRRSWPRRPAQRTDMTWWITAGSAR